ncbi:MAG: glucans biosynthesis glucosyltransferase MdoH [Beijerinckiaceae bacterium]
MDDVTTQSIADVSHTRPAMPPEMHLAMPVQSFEKWSKKDRYKWLDPDLSYTPWIPRIAVFGGGLLVTLYGAYEMYQVIKVGGVTILEWALLILFLLNFSWIALAFSSGIVGFVSLMRKKRSGLSVPQALKTRTAVVMPIYNEAPSRVFGAMKAMIADVRKTGLIAHFDFIFLSDTTDADGWIAEERALREVRAELPSDVGLYYRHRLKNTARKAGNIADFVSRWGGAYDHMLVLDADSVMTGESIVGLAYAMEKDIDAGIIQTLPLIINRNTLFARVQQFAARIYGPVIAEGLRLWMGRDGNYWGHNAIIRTKAFADYCAMPDLKGKPPFGGHIMSHDFVEAALIRRAGYAVYMVPGLVGSYEESPPSLIDLAARDRRWCQGNLQHSRVITAKGFHWATRQHFATGIMSYLASPLWLFQLIVGITIVLQSKFIRPEYFTGEFVLFPAWPRFDAERSLALFAATMLILLAPKIFGLLVTLRHADDRKGSGGGFKLVLSFFVEIIISALLAPVMMLIQSGAVFQILAGRDTGWKPQRRDDGSIPMKDIIRRHRSHVALGLMTGISAFLIATSLFAWMSPTIVGLLLAIQISWASGQLSIGMWLKKRGILLTPEETAPPEIVTDANKLSQELAAKGLDECDAIALLHADPAMRAHHIDMLPAAEKRARGVFSPERAMAETKLAEANHLEEVTQWLHPKERSVVLTDRALLSILARLPATAKA